MEIKAYGLQNHPDISSFYDDYGVDDSDGLFDAFGNQADEIDGIKLVWFHPEDDPDNVELHVWCDYDDRATIKRAIVGYLNSGLAESKTSEEKMSYEALLAEALKRIGNGPFTDDDDLEDSIMSTLDAMPYDIPEGTKEALATDIFGTLSDKITGKDDESKTDEAGLSPKLQDHLKFKEFAQFFNELPFFGQTIGDPLDTVRKEGLGYGVGNGSKEEQEEAAKDILSDFDDYVSWTTDQDPDGSWYIKMTFKPELWALPIEELKKVFSLLDDAFGPWS